MTNKTSDIYDEIAKEYEQTISSNTTYQNFIINFAQRFNASAEIIDIGCGPGTNAQIFINHDLKVTGIDSSKSMISIAKENCPSGIFIHGAVQEIGITRKYDGACLSFIIVHLTIDETKKLFQKIAEILKCKGFVYISFMSGKNSGYESTSFSAKEIFFNYYEPTVITELMQVYGFILDAHGTSKYKELDGSETDDHFMVFRKDGLD